MRDIGGYIIPLLLHSMNSTIPLKCVRDYSGENSLWGHTPVCEQQLRIKLYVYGGEGDVEFHLLH